MKVSDLICRLQAEHGDLTVVSTAYEQDYDDFEEYRTDSIQVCMTTDPG